MKTFLERSLLVFGASVTLGIATDRVPQSILGGFGAIAGVGAMSVPKTSKRTEDPKDPYDDGSTWEPWESKPCRVLTQHSKQSSNGSKAVNAVTSIGQDFSALETPSESQNTQGFEASETIEPEKSESPTEPKLEDFQSLTSESETLMESSLDPVSLKVVQGGLKDPLGLTDYERYFIQTASDLLAQGKTQRDALRQIKRPNSDKGFEGTYANEGKCIWEDLDLPLTTKDGREYTWSNREAKRRYSRQDFLKSPHRPIGTAKVSKGHLRAV